MLLAAVLLFLLQIFVAVVGGGLSHVGCILRPTNTNGGAHDLYFKPGVNNHGASEEEDSLKHPRQCVEACRKASFRYAGVGAECLCGNAYGSGGSSNNCAPCPHDNSLLCGSSLASAVYAVYNETQMLAPSTPEQLKAGINQENALQIFWKRPEGLLTGYKVTVKPLYSYSRDKVESRSWEFREPHLSSTHLGGLTPGTKYQVRLSAFNDNTESLPIVFETWTKIGMPDAPPAPKMTWYEGQKMGVSISPAENTKGPVSFYRLALIEDHQGGFFNKDSVLDWKEANELGRPYYVAAEWPAEALPSSFIVGSGNQVGSFFNGPLPTSKGHWHPALGVGSSFENTTKIQYSVTAHYQHSGLSLPSDKSMVEDIVAAAADGGGLVTILWIAIAITLLLLISCVSVLVLLKYNLMPGGRSRRRPRREAHPLTNSHPSSGPSTNVSTSYNEFAGFGGYTHLAFVSEEEDAGRRALQSLSNVNNIPRSEIILLEENQENLIGHGRFGPVFTSELKRGNQSVQVYQLPSPSNKASWNEEMFLSLEHVLRPSSHTNLVSISGFLQSETHLFLVVGGGERNLKMELLQLRQTTEKSSQSLIRCAMGVAEGLFHLHSYKLNHGELCSWSVVLPGDLESPKLTGFGALSFNPVNKERDGSRWMAVEQLHNRCTPPSDSWAFGILLWEIATLGGTPLSEIKTEDVKKRVLNGARPPQLDNMGDGLYQLMLTCWQLSREERPDAGTLACTLHELLHNANEELGLWDSFKWPVFLESAEFLPTRN